MGTPWDESQRRAVFAALRRRTEGRCRLTDYRNRIGLSGTRLAAGSGVNRSILYGLETGKLSPVTETSEWRETACRIADYLGVTCEWLWPQYARSIPTVPYEETASPSIDPESAVADVEAKMDVLAAVASLSPRLRYVIDHRFSLLNDSDEVGHEVIAQKLGVSRARVFQLQVQAFRELREKLGHLRDD